MDVIQYILSIPKCSGTGRTRHVFVKHGCPRRQQSRNMAKISKSYILTPPHPQGHVMSVKCEEPIDDGTELRTDGRTDRQADGQTHRRTIQLLDAPGGPFRPET